MLGLIVVGRKTSTALLGSAQHLWDDRHPTVATLVLFSVSLRWRCKSSLRSRSYSAPCASQCLVEAPDDFIVPSVVWTIRPGSCSDFQRRLQDIKRIISEFRERDRESKVYGRLRCDRCKLQVCNPVSGHKEFSLARGAAKRARPYSIAPSPIADTIGATKQNANAFAQVFQAAGQNTLESQPVLTPA